MNMKYIYGYNSNCNIVHGFELKQDRVLKTDVRFRTIWKVLGEGRN